MLPTRAWAARSRRRCIRSRSPTARATRAGRRGPRAGIERPAPDRTGTTGPEGLTPNGTLELRGDELEGGLAFLGGPYNNHHALRAVLEDAKRRGASRIVCLGDLGGFGPNPGKIYPILEAF